jgi:hypothetical protein
MSVFPSLVKAFPFSSLQRRVARLFSWHTPDFNSNFPFLLPSQLPPVQKVRPYGAWSDASGNRVHRATEGSGVSQSEAREGVGFENSVSV